METFSALHTGEIVPPSSFGLGPSLYVHGKWIPQSLSLSIEYKIGEPRHVYKRHFNFDKVHYRPVSVFTAISKLNESVMNDQFGQYFVDIPHKLLCAFERNIAVSQLDKMNEDGKKSLEKNYVIGALFKDLSKAFDDLPLCLLVTKFRAYGQSLRAYCLQMAVTLCIFDVLIIYPYQLCFINAFCCHVVFQVQILF